jgi:hypothetical protein
MTHRAKMINLESGAATANVLVPRRLRALFLRDAVEVLLAAQEEFFADGGG